MAEPVAGKRGQEGMRPLVVLEEAPPVNFLAAARFILRYRWVVLCAAFVFGAAGAAYALLADSWYRSSVVMVPVKSGAQPDFGQLAGLAGLAGIHLGEGGASQESIAVLHSRSFIGDFISSKNLLPELFERYWDESKGDWIVQDPAQRPDLPRAVEYFRNEILSVEQDSKAETVTISVQWKDADLAANWANELSVRINERMRRRALEEAEENVRYLRKEIASTNIVAMQQSMSQVLELEMSKLMMASGRKEYAFKVVDVAVPTRKRYRPQRALIVVLSTLAGIVASTGLLLVWRALADDFRRQSGGQGHG